MTTSPEIAADSQLADFVTGLTFAGAGDFTGTMTAITADITAAVPEPGSNLAMDCESGFGSAVFVTGAFGLVAAGEVVKDLVQAR